jgi:hypothetical protein
VSMNVSGKWTEPWLGEVCGRNLALLAGLQADLSLPSNRVHNLLSESLRYATSARSRLSWSTLAWNSW